MGRFALHLCGSCIRRELKNCWWRQSRARKGPVLHLRVTFRFTFAGCWQSAVVAACGVCTTSPLHRSASVHLGFKRFWVFPKPLSPKPWTSPLHQSGISALAPSLCGGSLVELHVHVLRGMWLWAAVEVHDVCLCLQRLVLWLVL